jgi:FkbH-like protein
LDAQRLKIKDMNNSAKRGLLISDFNIENLSAYLTNDQGIPSIESVIAPYGQVAQTLLDASQPCWQTELDFMVVWSRPEGVIESFQKLLAASPIDEDRLRNEVDDYCQKVAIGSRRVRITFVPTWIVPTIHLGHGMLDLAPRTGLSRAILQANLRLLENLDQIPNAFPLNASKWIELVGEKAFNPRLWYLGKIPFGNDVFKAAMLDIKAALRGISGEARKLIILDLDETMWGGIIGEVGWQNIILGGHDPAGEALVDFQRELKALVNRGVVLAIASKNEETVAIEAITKHPEMILRIDDFAAWRINWRDKAENIIELATDLNLGLDSVVFIDDSQVERDRIRQALPGVLVPEWPADKRLYPHALRRLDCFEQPRLTDEDRRRAETYLHERKRMELKTETTSLDEWLRTLDLSVRVEPLGPSNLSRTTQLLNKTNQMNLSTRRMTEPEFAAWATLPNHQVWVFHVSDRFGDSGLTGILSAETEDARCQIVDFVLSCRIIGRKVEETMLHVAIEWSRAAQISQVRAVYVPTAKNVPCRSFFQKSGLCVQSKNEFIWDAAREYPLHRAIRLVYDAGDTFERTPISVNPFKVNHATSSNNC